MGSLGTQFYRIGVDVGGTNTDAALAAARYETHSSRPKVDILASSKSPTTSDITTGISASIHDLLAKTQISTDHILSINIGTTQFVNAIVQADPTKLVPVAVLRLCGPFCREVPPFIDFPNDLKAVIEGPVGYLQGGLEFDGRIIADIDEAEVIKHAETLSSQGISTVVVNGVFSPLDSAPSTQEDRVKTILQRHMPRVDVVCSRDIGQVGSLERENAAILNASILAFGRRTIRRFQQAVEDLGIACPLYLTQNDGTMLDAYAASLAPVRTFSSGATNSLIGAIFLAGLHEPESTVNLKESQVIMCDIGGTTSDFAALSPSGLPRQSPVTVKIGGVRTAFSMPEVLSIGLGGGSEVHELASGTVRVGPRSVGHLLLEKSKCFGGSTLTATDIVVASGCGSKVVLPQTGLSDADPTVTKKARRNIQTQLEHGIDIMKTSDLPVILLLVGGGAIIQMDELRNVESCIRPPFSDVANAVGAAIAKISGDVDSIVVPGDRSYEDIKKDFATRATEAAIANGAEPSTVEVLELDLIPTQYTTNGAARVVAKAVGDLGWERQTQTQRQVIDDEVGSGKLSQQSQQPQSKASQSALPTLQDRDLASYRPKVSKATGEWFISSTDLMFIAEGTGILGTGGGGSFYTPYLSSLHTLQSAAEGKMRVIDPRSLKSGVNVAGLAYVGAPSVSNERLAGENEMQYATETLAKYKGIGSFAGLMASEIGGGNGLSTFSAAVALDLPIIDADTLGRAFPRIDMSLPYVFNAVSPAPAVVSDARGNVQVVAQVENATRFENLIRAISIEFGLYTAMVMMFSGETVTEYCPQRSLSACWFTGRAICVARALKLDVVEQLTKEIPGCRKIYSGKIVDVSRGVKGGWTTGTATMVLDTEENRDTTESTETRLADGRPLLLEYQNEFLYAALQNPDSSLKPVCTTPDLITVIDQNGTAIGTHELRYGLRVHVISMPADPLWKTPTGMDAGGPAAFGLDMQYKDYGVEWVQPRSVIEEFGE